MADLKTSELSSLTAGAVASGDLIPIVDVSANETKNIEFSELREAVLGDPSAPIANSDGTEADNARAINALLATLRTRREIDS